ncbi:hypothetical protein [Asanoa iriomotensis]|uniref:Uncharacterized protein n=1 Tax=Asanoa iriomotensis TaxID=234613 RepID=A0ABQ4C4K4_9ACTN|nr:hypothetical protein [Asanoa iriomotensis]GIF57689.1 hypothetical protein Air01nite_37840 [Asanoa iriomotensis]
MVYLAYCYTVATERLRSLSRGGEGDRGDNPVPTAIIIVGLALMAGIVVAWAMTTANNFMDQSDQIQELPAPGAGG